MLTQFYLKNSIMFTLLSSNPATWEQYNSKVMQNNHVIAQFYIKISIFTLLTSNPATRGSCVLCVPPLSRLIHLSTLIREASIPSTWQLTQTLAISQHEESKRLQSTQLRRDSYFSIYSCQSLGIVAGVVAKMLYPER